MELARSGPAEGFDLADKLVEKVGMQVAVSQCMCRTLMGLAMLGQCMVIGCTEGGPGYPPDGGVDEDASRSACVGDPIPPAGDPVGSVELAIMGPDDVFLASGCPTFSIAGLSRRAPTNDCVCECSNPFDFMAPPPPPPRELTPASAGPTLTWDGKESVPYQTCYSCGNIGAPQLGVVTVTENARVYVDPGTYTATLWVVDGVPEGCTTESDGVLRCPSCPAQREITIEIELPASGHAVIPVDVTP